MVTALTLFSEEGHQSGQHSVLASPEVKLNFLERIGQLVAIEATSIDALVPSSAACFFDSVG